MEEPPMATGVLSREFYTITRAATLLRVPPRTLEWWLEGGVRGDHEYPPVLRAEPTGSKMLTWGEFVEASYLREYRREHNVPLPHLRRFIDLLRERQGVPYPLAHSKPFVGEGRQLVLALQDEVKLPTSLLLFVMISGQIVLLPPADAFLSKVEFSQDAMQWAERLHPNGKRSPVVFDPAYSFGEPTVHGIRTDVLTELVEAGEAMDDVADQYGLTLADLKAAISYEFSAAA
jgi:uncharacterized protein (DUF433 family)